MSMGFSRKLRCLLLSTAALSLCLVMTACADSGEAAPEDGEQAAFSVPTAPPAAATPAYDEVRVYFDGLLTDRGYFSGNTVYLAPDAICDFYGLELTTRSDGSGFQLTAGGVELSGAYGQDYMEADSRYLFSPDGYLTANGKVYLPSDVIERVFGVSVDISFQPLRADVGTGGLNLIRGGEDYYDMRFATEDLYWLTHIIYAEAREQQLAGQIGVGNVIFNRIESDDFPDTIFDVIFDRSHAVQFDPTADGGVLSEPDEMSLIAACLCLEGYNTVGKSLFFVNPATGDSSWFEAELTFVITIGEHDFYA